MDTSSLTKESNVMSQAELDNLGATYSFSPGVRLRIPRNGETILSARQGEVAFYEAAFLAGLRLPIHPTIRKILIHYKICPAQLSPNAWRSVICSLVIWRHFKRHMSCDEFRCLYSLSPLLDLGGTTSRRGPRRTCSEDLRVLFIYDCEPLSSPDMRFSGKSCNKLPALSEVDAKRTETIFGKIEPGGYFEVSKVLGSRTFKKHFALGCTALSSSGGDNTTSGDDDGEFGTREDSVEYLGVIRWDIGGAIRRALPGIPDKTLLRVGLHFGFRDAPELRSDAMSARVGAPALGEKTGGKAKADKAMKATTAKPPTKGIVIREKRSESMMSDASVARRLLTGVIPASDKKRLINYPRMTWSPNLSMPWVVVFASSLAFRSEEHLHDIDFHMAHADSAELELVKAQKRAVKATVAELTNKLAKAKELAIEDFKASGEFKAAVTDSATTYFSEGFEFCKRQLLHQFPNLGVDVANMVMDPSFAEEEEAMKEGEDPVAEVAPDI
ncbi:hypothetical protein Acr_29g0006090 [Actinidia rufa]|uniref:Transposase (putative) gypsy type domain-containing protein n=1 Tax=Actinidia rufa TaxID=165716 RepID=A0A7J0HEA3_9ERIC|nr:hypothetical protein Acr_29g0006090 [Actinidia rufa]